MKSFFLNFSRAVLTELKVTLFDLKYSIIFVFSFSLAHSEFKIFIKNEKNRPIKNNKSGFISAEGYEERYEQLKSENRHMSFGEE